MRATGGDCRQVRDLLSDYSLGFLGDERAAAVRAHLAECDECAAALARLERLDGRLADECAAGDDEALVRAVMARVRAEVPPLAPRWVRLLDGLAPAVGLAIVGAVVVLALIGRVAEWSAKAGGLHVPAPLAPLAHVLGKPEGLAIVAVGAMCLAGMVAVASNRLAEVLAP